MHRNRKLNPLQAFSFQKDYAKQHPELIFQSILAAN